MDKINKLSLPVIILISSIILGSFYYATEVSKQKSVERQKEMMIEAENKRLEIENKRLEEEKNEAEKKRILKSNMLENCIKNAYIVYVNNWAKSCESNAKNISDGYKNCINEGNLNASMCRSVWGEPDNRNNCTLPNQIGKRWDDTYQKEKDECYKKYPQD